MRFLEPKGFPKFSLLEAQSTQSVEQTREHSPSLDWWWDQLGSFGWWFNHQCSDSGVCWSLCVGHWSLEHPVQQYPEYKWFGGAFSWPLDYVIIRVQVKGVWGYDEDQVALVIPDSTGFGSQVPVTLGTSTINWVINMIRKGEIDELSVSLNGSRITWLLACWWAGVLIQRETDAKQTMNPTDLNEVVKMSKK